MHKVIISIILSLLCIEATGSSKLDTLKHPAQKATYQLVKTDSIIVNKLSIIQITDYNPKTKRYLAYDQVSKACMELDQNGKILKEVDLTGEGPGHFGRGMSAMGYIGDTKVIEGGASYIFYDEDWNYLNKYTPGSGYLPSGPLPNDILGIAMDSENFIVKPIDQNYFGSKKLENHHFLTASMIEVFNGTSIKPNPFLAYPDNSVYQQKKVYYDFHRPHLSVNKTNQLLYLALPLEQKLYVYDLKKGLKLQEITTLKLEGFNSPEGISFNDQHKNPRKGFGPSNTRNTILNVTNSAIMDISSEGSTTILVHKTGTKRSDFTDVNKAYEAAKRQNKYFTSFMKNGEVVLSLEQRFKQMVRLDENRFITPYLSSEDEELDYNKFYIYELQKIN